MTENRISQIHDYNLDLESRTIFLHGAEPLEEEGEEPGVDYRMANRFIKNLKTLSGESDEQINIMMCTIGGDWFYGMAIHDAIKACPCRVEICVFSWARSMSSIILQAADRRIMMPNAAFMIHNGTTGYSGNYDAVKSGFEYEVTTAETMINIYADRCKHGDFFKEYELEGVKAYLKDKIKEKVDWWLTAEEAIDYGFADEVYKQ